MNNNYYVPPIIKIVNKVDWIVATIGICLTIYNLIKIGTDILVLGSNLVLINGIILMLSGAIAVAKVLAYIMCAVGGYIFSKLGMILYIIWEVVLTIVGMFIFILWLYYSRVGAFLF